MARKVNNMKYVAAIALTCLIFIGGLWIGSVITNSKVNDILSVEQEARLQLENLQLEQQLLEDTPCKSPQLLSESLEDLGTKLTYLETQYSKNDPSILELKKPYTLLEIKHYLAMKQMTELCNRNLTLILFFYSNDPANIDESEEQGFVLDYLRKKYSNVKAYSIDADMDLGIIDVLKSKYSISTVPSIVIDDKVYVGFHSKEELEQVIENK